MSLVVPGFVPVVPGPGFGRVMARFLGAENCFSLPLALSPLPLALALVALWPDFLGPRVVPRCPWLCPRCPWPWLWSRYGQISWGRELSLVVPGIVPVVSGPSLWSRHGPISCGRKLFLVVPGFVPVVCGPGFGRVRGRISCAPELSLVVPGPFVPVVPSLPGLGRVGGRFLVPPRCCPPLSLALSPLSLVLALVASAARFLVAASCPALPLALSPLSLAVALVALWPDFLGPKVVSRCPWLCPRCPWPWLWSRYGQISWGRELSLVAPGFVPVVPGPGFGRVMATFLRAESCFSLSLALSAFSLALALVALWPDFLGPRVVPRCPWLCSPLSLAVARARDNGDKTRGNEGQLAAPRNLAITRPKPGPGTTGTKPGTTRDNSRPQEIWP